MSDTRLLDCNAPGFIKRYFATSRLHHLSTWKADIADFVIGQMSSKRRSSPYKASRIEEPFRTIMHIDMDCFFASVGVRDRPHLLGKAIAVAHSQGGISLDYSTSEIASCNYEARAKGVKNGMFIGSAKELAPDLVIIPYEFEQYDACSRILYHTLLGTVDFVQSVSCDEAFVDVTFCVQRRLMEATRLVSVGDLQSLVERDTSFLSLYESTALALANEMRDTIFRETRCHASVGIASNILLARISTSKAKPNGVHSLLQHGKALLHLKDLPIRDLPGVGRSTSDKCAQLQLLTCGDVQAGGERNSSILTQLRKELGEKTGESLYAFCWGRDDRVLENKPRQSVGSDINWGIRFVSAEQVERFLKEYCAEVYDRLDRTMHTAGHVTVNVKKKLYEGEPGKFLGCGHCLDLSRSVVPGRVIASADSLYKCVSMLYKEIGLPPLEVRGIGIHLKKLQPRKTTGGSFFQTISTIPVKEKVAPGREETGVRLSSDRKEIGSRGASSAAQEAPYAANICHYFTQHATNALAECVPVQREPAGWMHDQKTEAAHSPLPHENPTPTPWSNGHGEGTGTQDSESSSDSNTSTHRPVPSASLQAMGGSAWSASAAVPDKNNEYHRHKSTNHLNHNPAVLSMDDVDLDVFMALPEEIQRELKRAFDSADTSSASSATATNQPGAHNKPVTNASKKGVNTSGSPLRKRAKTAANAVKGITRVAKQQQNTHKSGVARQPSITSIWEQK